MSGLVPVVADIGAVGAAADTVVAVVAVVAVVEESVNKWCLELHSGYQRISY